MNNLVIMKNKQAVTSSLQVAETFGKNHRDVLRAITNLQKDVRNFAQMFIETNIPDSYGRDRKAFYMNRDGFTLLAMGFTGKTALNFKLQYIQAFNHMEKVIKTSRMDSYMIDDPIERADRWKTEYLERKHLAEENKQLRIPALLGNAVSASDDSVTVGTFAKILRQKGIPMGQNRLFEWLRGHGFLIRGGRRHNAPTQRAMELKVMEVRETVVNTNHGAVNKFTPLITGKGQQYFASKFLKQKEQHEEVRE